MPQTILGVSIGSRDLIEPPPNPLVPAFLLLEEDEEFTSFLLLEEDDGEMTAGLMLEESEILVFHGRTTEKAD